MIELVLGFFFTLILGGYGFTWMVFDRLGKKIDRLETNHFAHIRKHLRNECGEDCEYCN